MRSAWESWLEEDKIGVEEATFARIDKHLDEVAPRRCPSRACVRTLEEEYYCKNFLLVR